MLPLRSHPAFCESVRCAGKPRSVVCGTVLTNQSPRHLGGGKDRVHFAFGFCSGTAVVIKCELGRKVSQRRGILVVRGIKWQPSGMRGG